MKFDRGQMLQQLQLCYKDCFDSPISLCSYDESGFGLRADDIIEVFFKAEITHCSLEK